jgi:uncharacterized protein (TIGR02266 family)
MLVADYLGQPELEHALEAHGTTHSDVADLRRLSRAIQHVVLELGGDYLSDAAGVPGDLVSRGEAVRTSITSALTNELPTDHKVALWLEAIRLGNGVVDLVYDLRSLVELCRDHRPAADSVPATVVHAAYAAADAIEFALRTGDAPEVAAARNTLARLWTLFVPAYQRAVRVGESLVGEGEKVMHFPPLAVVASHRRARRRPVSLVPGGAVSSIPPSFRKSARPHSKSQAPGSRASIPSAPALPDFDKVALIEAHPALPSLPELAHDAPVRPRSEAPTTPSSSPRSTETRDSAAPTSQGAREHWSDTRTSQRHTLEIEVCLTSESNFYLGFTENLSPTGVFVATYAGKALGTHVFVVLTFPDGTELKVPGQVRWLREASPDVWPGMGVQFDELSEGDQAKIREFLTLREPLFFEA